MFLQASVILSTGGDLPQCMLEYHNHPPPRADPPRSRPLGSRHPPEQITSPGSRHPPRPDPPRSRHPPGADTPLGSRCQHTVNEWPVHILLECILVLAIFTARKRSLGQGNVFAPHQVDTPTRGRPPSGRRPRADTPPGRHPPWADTSPLLDTTGYGQQAGSTHPTGIHTCYLNVVENLKQKNHLSKKPIKMLLCLTRDPFSQAP